MGMWFFSSTVHQPQSREREDRQLDWHSIGDEGAAGEGGQEDEDLNESALEGMGD